MLALMARAPLAGKPLRQQLRESADYDTASFAGAQGEDLINRGCTTLVLHVECMDSSGIGTVIALSRTFDHGVGTLHLRHAIDVPGHRRDQPARRCADQFGVVGQPGHLFE
ncbi:hypothetical protein [Streptomyces sp. NPDC059168]|uniref:hypothetical protein n=1 Tax=Streptomyces sp. NPDC059168 TaxID=3346753 RepID=UPI0036A36884